MELSLPLEPLADACAINPNPILISGIPACAADSTAVCVDTLSRLNKPGEKPIDSEHAEADRF